MKNHPFHFLSQSFSYPEKNTIQHNRTTLCLLAADTGIDPIPPELMQEILLQDLQTEYVRLFINAVNGAVAHPYASVYVHDAGILCQQGHDDALAYYSRAEMEPLATDESPDHIAYELAFVGILLDKGSDKLLDSFVTKHLMTWFPNFLQTLLKAKPHPFYSVLGQVTNLCLKHISKEVVHEQKTFS